MVSTTAELSTVPAARKPGRHRNIFGLNILEIVELWTGSEVSKFSEIMKPLNPRFATKIKLGFDRIFGSSSKI